VPPRVRTLFETSGPGQRVGKQTGERNSKNDPCAEKGGPPGLVGAYSPEQGKNGGLKKRVVTLNSAVPGDVGQASGPLLSHGVGCDRLSREPFEKDRAIEKPGRCQRVQEPVGLSGSRVGAGAGDPKRPIISHTESSGEEKKRRERQRLGSAVGQVRRGLVRKRHFSRNESFDRVSARRTER